MTINTENFPKAELAITYRKDICKAVNELSQYHEEYGSLILSALEENPQITADELKEIIFQRFDRDYKPYEDQKLNDALVDVSILGVEAVAEMKSIIDILGDTTDLVEAKKLLGIKYGNTPPERDINLSTKDEVTDLDVETASINPLEPELIDEEFKIFKVRKTTGANEYKWNGKSFYNYERAKEAAKKAKESGSYDTLKPSLFETSEYQDQKLVKALGGIKTGVITGYVQIAFALIAGIFFTFVALSKSRSFTLSDNLEILFFYIWAGLLGFLVFKLKQKSYFAAVTLFSLTVAPPVLELFFVGVLDGLRGLIWTIIFGYGFYRGVQGTKQYRQIMKAQGARHETS